MNPGRLFACMFLFGFVGVLAMNAITACEKTPEKGPDWVLLARQAQSAHPPHIDETAAQLEKLGTDAQPQIKKLLTEITQLPKTAHGVEQAAAKLKPFLANFFETFRGKAEGTPKEVAVLKAVVIHAMRGFVCLAGQQLRGKSVDEAVALLHATEGLMEAMQERNRLALHSEIGQAMGESLYVQALRLSPSLRKMNPP